MNSKTISIISLIVVVIVFVLIIVFTGRDKEEEKAESKEKEEKTFELKYANFADLHSSIRENSDWVWWPDLPARPFNDYLWGLGNRLGRPGRRFHETGGYGFRSHLKEKLFNGNESNMDFNLKHIFGDTANRKDFIRMFDLGAAAAAQ